jgi:hypothetical protein
MGKRHLGIFLCWLQIVDILRERIKEEKNVCGPKLNLKIKKTLKI